MVVVERQSRRPRKAARAGSSGVRESGGADRVPASSSLPAMGPKLECLDWPLPYARITTRLAASTSQPCKVMSMRDGRGILPIGPGGALIAIDKFVIRKGHRYATVIGEPSSMRVLWVGRGTHVRKSGFL